MDADNGFSFSGDGGIYLVASCAVAALFPACDYNRSFDDSDALPKSLRYAFGVSVKYFLYTFHIAFVVVIFIILNLTIVLANFITLSIGVGIVAYILSL